MGKADRISGIFWLIFSVFVSMESYNLGLGSLRKPGPGFLFFWIGVLLGIMSLLVILRSRRAQPAREGPLRGLNVTKIILVLIALFLYALFMERLGFILVTLGLFLLLLGIIEKKRWSFTLLVSVLVTAATYLIFEVGLQSQLPKGLLEFLRF